MKQATEALEHASVRQYCKALRVPVIGANFIPLAEQAVKEKRNHIGYLEALLAMEAEERDRHAVQTRMHDARLPRIKTLEEFDFNQAPSQAPARHTWPRGCAWLRAARSGACALPLQPTWSTNWSKLNNRTGCGACWRNGCDTV